MNEQVGPSSQSGIYAIHNLRNGKQYIGSAKRFKQRWYLHRLELKRGEHHSEILQRAWKKYGEDAFEFQILEIVNDLDMILQREQFYLDTRKPAYNICLIAGSRMGLKNKEIHKARIRAALNTPESQARLSARWKGKKQSEEHLAARAEAMRGNANGKGKVISPEERAAMNAGLAKARAKGKVNKPKWTPEMRAKAAENARKGHALKTPEERSALAREARLAQSINADTKAKLAEATRARMASMSDAERAEHARKISEGKRRNPMTEEQRAAKSAAIKTALAAKGPRPPLSEEERAARSAATIAGKAAAKAMRAKS